MKRLFFVLLAVVYFSGCKSSIVDDPTTKINFSVPVRSLVTLKVENNYNTVVQTLLENEEMEAGAHAVSFDANGLAEGVYFYTMEINGIESNYHAKMTKYLLMVK